MNLKENLDLKEKFSPNLFEYLKKIEIETGRKIKFLESPDLGIKGINAAYRYHTQYILIILNPETPRPPEDTERSIAHEATHGYLMHKLGFCRPVFNAGMDDNYKKDVQLIFTMLEDIVVNKIIQDNGFPPFGREYLLMVREEIEVAHKGEEEGESFYQRFADEPHLEALLMISRYIIAWGFLKYYHLEPQETELIGDFVETFQKFYPDYYKFAVKVEEIMEENDIFRADGECKAIQMILHLFKMNDGVRLTRNR